MTISREKFQQIANDFDEALKAVAKKHGLANPDICVRRAHDGSFVRISKVDIYESVFAEPLPEPAKQTIFNGAQDGVSTELRAALTRIGVTRTQNSRGEQIVGYKPRNHVYPFIIVGPRGGRWKVSADQIKMRFG